LIETLRGNVSSESIGIGSIFFKPLEILFIHSMSKIVSREVEKKEKKNEYFL
jgi:hypothetical protein